MVTFVLKFYRGFSRLSSLVRDVTFTSDAILEIFGASERK